MADVRYVVSVDSAGAVTAIQKLDGEFNKLEKDTKSVGEGADQAAGGFGQMFSAMTLAQLAADAIRKTISGLKTVMVDSVKEAMNQEKADNALRASLMATGRTVEGNIAHYKGLASELQKTTVYSDDAVEGAQALMLSLTNLDQQGIDKATKGAMGLATVFGMDLQSAATMVAKAMEGNYAALGRYGIKVDENLSAEEKQVALLDKLSGFYKQTEEQVKTFAGGLAVLKNQWSDTQEEIGNAVIKNESVQKAIEAVKVSMETIKPVLEDFVGGVATFIADMARVASAAIEAIEKVRKYIGGGRSELTEEEKAWDRVMVKLGGFTGAVQKINSAMLQMNKYSKESIDVSDTLGDKLWASFNEIGERATYAKIAAGDFGTMAKEAFIVVGGEAAKVAVSLAPAKEGINQTGNAADIAAEKANKLKAELKLVFTSDTQAQIDKYNLALVTFRDRLSPDAVEGIKKKVAELTALLPKAFTGVNVDALGTATRTLAEDLMAAGVAAKDMQKEAGPSLADVTAELEKAASRAKAYDDRMKQLGGMTVKETRLRMEEIRETIRRFGTDTGPTAERVKELEAELKRLGKSLEQSSAFDVWAEKASAAMDRVRQYSDMVFGAMDAVFQQAQRNKEIAIDNEYKKKVENINRTVKDEKKRAELLSALEAEYQIKKTAAQAAAAKQSKAIAMMEAVVNTADAVTKALTAGPFIGPILAGIIGAMGAIQIALIAKQPIPLAKGAWFQRPTLLAASTGQHFEVAEAGPEVVAPESKLKAAFRDVVRELFPVLPTAAMAGAGGPIININSPLIQTTGLSQAEIEAAAPKLFEQVERQLRLRGRM